jgi:hypothetical protein
MGTPFHKQTLALGMVLVGTSLAVGFSACNDSYRPALVGTGGSTSSSTTVSSTSTGGQGGVNFDSGPPCDNTCSNDLKTVVDCMGVVQKTCTVDQGCANAMCIDDPCHAAELSQSSYGCDYWALKTAQRLQADGACFAVFVANTWGKPVHLDVQRDGAPLQVLGTTLKVSDYTYIPQGQGQAVTYTPYDDVAGLGVGQVAVLFLSRLSTGSVVDCPKPAALDEETGVPGTGRGSGFHITSDYPVVAYQMVPYGGGQAGVTSATLLLPTSAWDVNYIAVNAYKSAATDTPPAGDPSLDIVAYKDNTQVTILPKAAIVAGTNVAASAANTPVTYTLQTGQFLQITQAEELTGSVIQSTEAIGVFGASSCMNVPLMQGNCDSAQQQLPPVRALGSEYVGVRYRGRGQNLDGGVQDEAVPWRLVGAVDGTTLTWDPLTPPGAPKSLALGELAEFTTTGPFVVKSQDVDHPFYLGAYMTGGKLFKGEGDPDWVNVITPPQFLNDYVFFTDPTYPETDLVLVRSPSKVDGSFADVTLNCAGAPAGQTVTGWTAIGAYEYTRVDLVTGNFMGQNGCENGRQELLSPLPFGVTVWGWGATQQTQFVSYAYPAGAGFQPINSVVIPPIPK